MDWTSEDPTRTWLRDRYWSDDALLERARTSFAETGPLIEVSRDSGAALATLVRVSGAHQVIEVGTLFGYSAVQMARALPPAGRLDTLEIDDGYADRAQSLFRDAGLGDRITLHRGAALDTLHALEGPWGLAFLDARKEEYADYARSLIPKLRIGATIIADNVAAGGRLVDPDEHGDHVEALRAYHSYLAEEPRLASNVLPIGDGLAVSVVLAH